MASTYPMTERHAFPKPTFTPVRDVERGQAGTGHPILGSPVMDNATPPKHSSSRPDNSRTSSFLRDITHFDTVKAPEQFRVAQGDAPDNSVTRVYNYLIGVSVVTRWILFIVPILGLLWIPGILGLTAFPNGHIWFTRLLWWSVWFSVLWGGYWAALAFSYIFPKVVRYTLGFIAVGIRRYVDWLVAIHRYVAIFLWALASFISFQPLVRGRQNGDATEGAKKALDVCSRILFGILICSAILLGEKIFIQIVATQFHERSYAERLADQRRSTRFLVTLYANSTDQVDRNDTLRDGPAGSSSGKIDTDKLMKNVLGGVRGVFQSTTQAFGNIATEITGSSVLQPNSPQAIVAQALTSANKTRLLARRIFYSFRNSKMGVVVVGDIERYFGDRDIALEAFSMLDRDGNGDVTREEVELACMELHREKLALARSMRDIDSAVGRLDSILMTLYVFAAAIIFAVTLNAAVSTLLSGVAAFVLALGWFIGPSVQEIVASIIFLFVKHSYDVGDRVDIDGSTYTVKEMRLLSTIFIDTRGCQVQAPNVLLNTKFIFNHRRSQQMSEPFTFDIAWDTSFEQLEKLRSYMLAFLKGEGRDFLPVFDVTVDGFNDQSKLVVKADIKYKSNWQQGALKVQRRNKWICALKGALKECQIWGPSGDPNAIVPPAEYTQVPWEEVKASKETATQPQQPSQEPLLPKSDYRLVDSNRVVLDQSQDVFGESRDMAMTAPRQPATARQRQLQGQQGAASGVAAKAAGAAASGASDAHP